MSVPNPIIDAATTKNESDQNLSPAAAEAYRNAIAAAVNQPTTNPLNVEAEQAYRRALASATHTIITQRTAEVAAAEAERNMRAVAAAYRNAMASAEREVAKQKVKMAEEIEANALREAANRRAVVVARLEAVARLKTAEVASAARAETARRSLEVAAKMLAERKAAEVAAGARLAAVRRAAEAAAKAEVERKIAVAAKAEADRKAAEAAREEAKRREEARFKPTYDISKPLAQQIIDADSSFMRLSTLLNDDNDILFNEILQTAVLNPFFKNNNYINKKVNGATLINQVFTKLVRTYRGAADYAPTCPLKNKIVSLINANANLKEIYSESISMLGFLADFMQMPEGITRSEITETWNEINTIKLQALRFHLKGIKTTGSGYSFSREGIHVTAIAPAMVQAYNDFTHLMGTPSSTRDRDMNIILNRLVSSSVSVDHLKICRDKGVSSPAEKIKRNFNSILKPITIEEARLMRSRGETIAIPLLTTITSTGDHSMSYVVVGDYVLRINMGATVGVRKPGITVFKVGNAAGLDRELPKLLDSRRVPVSDLYLLGEFQRACALTEALYIPIEAQTVGNCTFVSTETLLQGISFAEMLIYAKSHAATAVAGKVLSERELLVAANEASSAWHTLFVRNDRNEAASFCFAYNEAHPHTTLTHTAAPLIKKEVDRAAAAERGSFTPIYAGAVGAAAPSRDLHIGAHAPRVY